MPPTRIPVPFFSCHGTSIALVSGSGAGRCGQGLTWSSTFVAAAHFPHGHAGGVRPADPSNEPRFVGRQGALLRQGRTVARDDDLVPLASAHLETRSSLTRSWGPPSPKGVPPCSSCRRLQRNTIFSCLTTATTAGSASRTPTGRGLTMTALGLRCAARSPRAPFAVDSCQRVGADHARRGLVGARSSQGAR
jgi:hypothetical protein